MKKLIIYLIMCMLTIFVVNGALIDDIHVSYTFDNDSIIGDVMIDSAGNENGTGNSVFGGVKGHLGDSVVFEGGIDVITIIENQNVNITIALWTFWGGTNANFQNMLGSDSSFHTLMLNTGTADVGWYNGGFHDSGDHIRTNFWDFFVVVITGNNYVLYLNNVLVQNDTNVLASNSVNGLARIGNYATNTQGFSGRIDQVTVWNRSITEEEIVEIWNGGNGLDPFDIPFIPSNNLNLTLLNNVKQQYSSISERDEFWITINYTNSSDDIILGADCNFTSNNNITAHFKNSSVNNFSLSTSLDELNLNVNEGVTNLLIDNINFRVCKETSPSPTLSIFVNDVLHKTLSAEIPLCSIGFHTENNMTTDFIGLSSVNVSLRCLDCGSATRELTILSDNQNDLLHFERQFSTHTETNMPFNASNGLYEYNGHQYEYLSSGLTKGNIFITCNDDTKTEIFEVFDIGLTIQILSIDDILFVDGLQIESSDSTDIIIEIFGDIIQSLEFNVTYENGTLIKNTNLEFMSLSELNLNIDGIYNISIEAIDDEGNVTIKKGYFLLNDTTNPIITFTNPNSDNSSIFLLNSTTFIQMVFSDLNLFAYEVIILDPNGFIVNTFNKININSSSSSLSQIMNLSVIGIYQINASVSDDHTKQDIEDYNYIIKDTEDMLFLFKDYNISIDYTGKYGIRELNLIKEFDRYSFDYDFNYALDLNDEWIKHSFEISCPNIVYRKDSVYKAHFVCGNGLGGHWIDFESPNQNIEVEVKQKSEDTYEIDMNMKPERLKLSSIGGLNIVNQMINFSIVQEFPSEPLDIFNLDFNETTTYLIIFFVLALMVVLFYFSFLFKTLVPAMGGVIVGIILGFMLIPLNIILGVCVMAFMMILFISMLKI